MAGKSFACALLVLMIAIAACAGGERSATTTTSSAQNGGSQRATVTLITHQTPGDTFWDLVRRGAEAAATKDGLNLQYSHDPDVAAQANLVRSAVSAKVAGIAVTLAEPGTIAPAVQTAIATGIPVVAVNSGIADWKAMGVMEFFGQDETIAGQAAGDRFTHEGAQNALCVIHEPGHVGLEARCDGLARAFKGKTQKLYVNGVDSATVKRAVTAKLQQDFSVDRILSLGAPMALASLEAVAEMNSYAKVATFDTNAGVVEAIKNGMIEWAIDQQPFLQGYLAIDALWLYFTNKNVIGGGQPTLTGPSFVDETNINSVADLAGAGTR
jgi:simple sugar transport system substrate-binding protein